MNLANSEALAPPCPVAASIQTFDDFLQTKRGRAAVPEKVQLEDEPYRFLLDRIDFEVFLDFCATLFRFDQPITKWRRCPVPEPLAGVFLHRSDDVLGVFLRLIFVEERNNLSHHCMNRFSLVTNGLSYGNDPDGMLGKLAEVEFLLEGLPEEPAIAVDNDKIEG